MKATAFLLHGGPTLEDLERCQHAVGGNCFLQLAFPGPQIGLPGMLHGQEYSQDCHLNAVLHEENSAIWHLDGSFDFCGIRVPFAAACMPSPGNRAAAGGEIMMDIANLVVPMYKCRWCGREFAGPTFIGGLDNARDCEIASPTITHPCPRAMPAIMTRTGVCDLVGILSD